METLISRNDFQRRDFVAFQSEKEPKIHGAARKVAGESTGHNELPVLVFARKRFARVLVLGRGLRFPLLDRGLAVVGVSLIRHDGSFSKALRNRLAVALIGGEVGGDGCRQFELHVQLLCIRCFA